MIVTMVEQVRRESLDPVSYLMRIMGRKMVEAAFFDLKSNCLTQWQNKHSYEPPEAPLPCIRVVVSHGEGTMFMPP